MKKIISIILTLTLLLSFAPAVFAEETETVGGKITLTQFLGSTLDNTKGISLSYAGTTITANASDFYAIADKIILTSQLDIQQTSMDGLHITARKNDDTFEYAYITPSGEVDKHSLSMSRLPYAMYIADDAELVSELFTLVSVNIPSISDWAVDTIARANAEGFIPEDFGVANYTQNITREQFCDLAFTMLHKKIGMEHSENIGAFLLKDGIEAMDYVENIEDYSLKNAVSKSVVTLYDFNIIKGKREVRKPVEPDGYPFPFIDFAPSDFITREEAATILDRIHSLLFIKANPKQRPVPQYKDDDEISDYAKKAVYRMRSEGIMNGVSADAALNDVPQHTEFAPKASYTIEQSIATILRISEPTSKYETASIVLRQYFDAYANADYETMKQYSTTRHVEQSFHDGDVWGYKWAKLTSIEPVNRDTDNDECIFLVSVEVETVPASSQYPDTKGSFYVILKLENGAWKIDEYATGL